MKRNECIRFFFKLQLELVITFLTKTFFTEIDVHYFVILASEIELKFGRYKEMCDDNNTSLIKLSNVIQINDL